jgi:hypothetical protein
MGKNKKKDASEFLTVLFCGPIFVLIPGLTVTAFLGTLGWQIFSYLRSGFWQSISSIDGLSFIFQNTKFGLWLENPDSWYGIYDLANWLPLSLAIVVTGVMIEFLLMVLALVVLSDK